MILLTTRYFIFLSYNGTSYHGWQLQPNSVTIQSVLEDALGTLLSEEISTTGAGRTDTGVHATFFCAHFDSSHSDLDERNNFIYRLNRYLPKDISVTRIRKVKKEANARFSATSRTYKYYISREKNPFNYESSWYIHGNLDIENMNNAAAILLRYRDFTSFSKLHTDVRTNICMIKEARWEESGNDLIFTITADRFLRNMVRSIVGTLADIGSGKKTTDDFIRIIEAKDRRMAGKSAPAKGLYLTSIEYPDDIYI